MPLRARWRGWPIRGPVLSHSQSLDSTIISPPRMPSTPPFLKWIEICQINGLRLIRIIGVAWQGGIRCPGRIRWRIPWGTPPPLHQARAICSTHLVAASRIVSKISLQTSNRTPTIAHKVLIILLKQAQLARKRAHRKLVACSRLARRLSLIEARMLGAYQISRLEIGWKE